MAVPSLYSESQFCAYLVSVLHEVGPILGWDPGSPQVQEAKNDALLELGLSEIADAPNIRALRALGRRAIWRGVVQAVATKYDFSDSDAKFTRSQIQAMALEALKLAESDCLEFNPNYSASIVKISRPHDPYVVLLDEDRVP